MHDKKTFKNCYITLINYLKMKKLSFVFSSLVNLTIVLVLGYAAYYFFAPGKNAVTHEQFEKNSAKVSLEFDSLKRYMLKVDKDIQKLSVKVDSIRLNIDTLKAGQNVIYSEVLKQPKEFSESIFEFFLKKKKPE